ncbi:MAG: NGG1p interacting factor NIF3 [Candidatus Caldatribacteriota bacterium]
MYIIAVYCPSTHLDKIKEEMFAAGGGQIGEYDCCSFEYKGIGQFRASSKANPFLGKAGEVERVEEIKLEMVCKKELVSRVLMAMKKAHPYEEPAYHVLKNYSDQF